MIIASESRESLIRDDSLASRANVYKNSAAHNAGLHSEFTQLTDGVELLKHHRDVIEANLWGTGDRAFHYMWYLILQDISQRSAAVDCLEIGVFKGQVLSLWALIGKSVALEVRPVGVSNFAGSRPRHLPGRVLDKLRRYISVERRRAYEEGNVYPDEDYMRIVAEVFARFDLDLGQTRLVRGDSHDAATREQVALRRYQVIYIDGDHSLEGVRADILDYSPLLADDGYLVLDDASFFLPGEGFFKGHRAVSIACDELMPRLGFENLLNVGHNRIFRRRPRSGDAASG
jgi:hypothetical protein